MKRKYVECQCGAIEHVIRFTIDHDDEIIYIDTYLGSKKFFKRLYYGIKYILGYESKYGHFNETIIGEEEVEEIRDLCNEFLDLCNNKN